MPKVTRSLLDGRRQCRWFRPFFGICRSRIMKSAMANEGSPGLSVVLDWRQKCSVQRATAMIETAKNTEDIRKEAVDLYWLAFLLTERQDLSVDIAADTADEGRPPTSLALGRSVSPSRTAITRLRGHTNG
jgi:hypothetical protein